MKFSDKIYTYKDIEEAKKLIGRKVIKGNVLKAIENPTGDIIVEKLVKIQPDSSFPFITDGQVNDYEFIREVIEDEPSYRPFKSIAELVEYWCKNNNNLWQHRNLTIPLIWVKDKNTGHNCLIIEYNKDCVFMNGDDVGVSMEELFNEYEFLDGSPIGVVIE